MKLYRLKEEAKKYFHEALWNKEMDTLEWYSPNHVTIEALEEVESRVELTYGDYEPYDYKVLRKRCNSDISQEERMLCEQALNGELFTEHQMKLYGVWKRKNPMGTVEKWLKQEA